MDLLFQERRAVIEGKKKTIFYKGRLTGQVKAGTFRIVDGKVSEIELENAAFIGPDCLGTACVIEGSSFRTPLTRLGQPERTGSTWEPYYCYQSENDGTFLYLAMGHGSTPEVEAVEVSDFPNCVRTLPTTAKIDLREWRIPEGIGLGSPQEEVLEACALTTNLTP